MRAILHDFSRVAYTEILAFIAHHSRMVVSFLELSLPLGHLNATKWKFKVVEGYFGFGLPKLCCLWDFTRFNCVLILVHGMWVSPIHLMKKRNTVYSWISWSVITASVKTVGTFWMWVMGERFLFTANNLLIVSHLFVC